MTPYHITRNIAAPPGKIWSILTDAKLLSDGQFSIIKIDGQIAKGQSFKLWPEVDPTRAFPINVAVMHETSAWNGMVVCRLACFWATDSSS